MTGVRPGVGEHDERRPDWLDRDRYPFESHWLDLPEGRVHYVDVGPGATDGGRSAGRRGRADEQTVVFVHGNPTWSYLYRHLLRELSEEYRCLAPDLLGFGLSEAPATFTYLPADHARVLGRLLESLSIGEVVLVVHDWGGPLGLDYATRNPDDVAGIVAMNTWCWPRERTFDRVSSRFAETGVGRRLLVEYDAVTRLSIAPLVGSAIGRGRWRRARELRQHYLGPQASRQARVATWVLAREVGRSHEWLQRIWNHTMAIEDAPVRLLWGTRDPVHRSFLQRWTAAFPKARTTTFEDVGHFVPEEKGRDLVAPVREFVTDRCFS